MDEGLVGIRVVVQKVDRVKVLEEVGEMDRIENLKIAKKIFNEFFLAYMPKSVEEKRRSLESFVSSTKRVKKWFIMWVDKEIERCGKELEKGKTKS